MARDFSFILTAEMIAAQTPMTLKEAQEYIKDLKYVGFFMSASNGDAIEILPPNPDDRQHEIKAMQDYEKTMPTKEELRRKGV